MLCQYTHCSVSCAKLKLPEYSGPTALAWGVNDRGAFCVKAPLTYR